MQIEPSNWHKQKQQEKIQNELLQLNKLDDLVKDTRSFKIVFDMQITPPLRMHYYFFLFSCSLFLSLSALVKAVPMYEEEKLREEPSSTKCEQVKQEVTLHQRQLTDSDEADSLELQQRGQEPAAIVEQRKELSNSENFINNEDMELRVELLPLPPGDIDDRNRTINFETTPLEHQQKGLISLDKESGNVSVERVASTIDNKYSSKIKSIKDRLWDCERNFKSTNSGLEIAIDDVSTDDPQRAIKIATLHEINYLPMKANLEKTLNLVTKNHAFQDRAHAILLAKLAVRTIEIADRSIPVENLNPVLDHESTMIRSSANSACLNLVDLLKVLNASKDEIGKELRECQIKMAKRALFIADEKFSYAFRKKFELSHRKTESSPEALAQAEIELQTITPFFSACGTDLFTIESSAPITDPYEARRVAIDHIINLAQSAITTANELRTTLSLKKSN